MGNGLASPLPVLALPPAFAGSTTSTVFENSVLTAAAALPILLALVPMAVWVKTRSVDRTLRLMRTPSLWAAIMNSVIWVLFAFIAAKRVECMELVLAYPILLTLNFTYLLLEYGYRKNLWMAAILSLLVLSCLGYVFYAIKFESCLPMSWETILGIGGLLILMLSHGCLIDDIKAAIGAFEYAISLLNVVPPGFLNIATCYIILKRHPEQQYIAYSGLIGFFFAILELMLMFSKAMRGMFSGGNNGPPALPPDPVNLAQLHAQTAASSAARAEAAEGRVNEIAEALAQQRAAAGQQQLLAQQCAAAWQHQRGVENNGCNLGDSKGTLSSKDLPITKLPEEVTTDLGELNTAELEKNTTQLLQSAAASAVQAKAAEARANEVAEVLAQQRAAAGQHQRGVENNGCNLGDSKGTLSSKDLPITKLPEEVTTDLGELKTAELEKNTTQLLPSGSSDGDKIGPGKNERYRSETSGESKSLKSQVLAPIGSSGGSCTPRGWRRYLFRVNRPQTC